MKIELHKIGTERRNPDTIDIDQVATIDICRKINNEDQKVATAVARALPEIAKLIDAIVAAFNKDGRLIYLGAGTSGRIGILDAVECRPTFGVSEETVMCLMAGGEKAFVKAVEGAEDAQEAAVADLKRVRLRSADIVVGIAASGRTPYVLSGVEYAKSLGCLTGAIVTSGDSPLARSADIAVEAITGSEALTGSTRMKSGTAQKMICNMLSTAAMIKMGKVYENLMIDVLPTNEKLRSRARSILIDAAGVGEDEAQDALNRFGGVKEALFALLSGITDPAEVKNRLSAVKGNIRTALKAAQK